MAQKWWWNFKWTTKNGWKNSILVWTRGRAADRVRSQAVLEALATGHLFNVGETFYFSDILSSITAAVCHSSQAIHWKSGSSEKYKFLRHQRKFLICDSGYTVPVLPWQGSITRPSHGICQVRPFENRVGCARWYTVALCTCSTIAQIVATSRLCVATKKWKIGKIARGNIAREKIARGTSDGGEHTVLLASVWQ